ncbi:hypothetical protein AOE57_01850 [Candidatus Riesia pediculicola]|nr:hypothetical protein AOE57_01850 [Candidatus Riesia pediculicola]
MFLKIRKDTKLKNIPEKVVIDGVWIIHFFKKFLIIYKNYIKTIFFIYLKNSYKLNRINI